MKLLLMVVMLAGCVEPRESHRNCSDWCREVGAKQVAFDRSGRCACVVDILPDPQPAPSCPPNMYPVK